MKSPFVNFSGCGLVGLFGEVCLFVLFLFCMFYLLGVYVLVSRTTNITHYFAWVNPQLPPLSMCISNIAPVDVSGTYNLFYCLSSIKRANSRFFCDCQVMIW